jgi:hypothetical protein
MKTYLHHYPHGLRAPFSDTRSYFVRQPRLNPAEAARLRVKLTECARILIGSTVVCLIDSKLGRNQLKRKARRLRRELRIT